jgi:sulfhydrogenase subunit delta
MEKAKPKVGVFGITGCQGCHLSILFIEDILFDLISNIDLQVFSFIKGKNNLNAKYDIAIIEGVVVSTEDIDIIKKIRENSKFLIALGTCATHGNVPAMKNFMNKKDVESVYKTTKHLNSVDPAPIDKYVKVDFYVSGCPPDKNEITELFKSLFIGKKLVKFDNPVCYECALKENNCILYQGKKCLGPLSRGGCNALCPSVNKDCTGCRGPIEDTNVSAMINALKERGIPIELITDKINKYASLKFKELYDAEKIKKDEKTIVE